MKKNRAIAFVLEVQRRYGADRGGAMGATITYNAFLSLFPLLLLTVSLIGFVLTDPAERLRWVGRIADAIPGLSAVADENLRAITDDRATIGIIGLVTLMWTGTNIVRASGLALNTIYEVPHQSGLASQVWAVSTLWALGALALSSVAASAVIGSIGDGIPFMILAAAVGIAMDFVLFVMSYRLLTHGRGPRFARLWVGALFAACGWTALKAIGVWYAARTVADAQAVYGAFAATVGLLVVLSLGARIFLYGAEINAVLLDRSRDAPAKKAISLSRHREMRKRTTTS